MRQLCWIIAGMLFAGCAKQSAPAVPMEERATAPRATVPPPAPVAPTVRPRPKGRPATKGAPRRSKARRRMETKEKAKPAAGPTLRAGARRLEAVPRQGHEVRFDGDKGIRLPAVERARGKRRLAAVVDPLAQTPRSGGRAGASDVGKAGEIVALALGRQLELLGWQVAMSGGTPSPAPAKPGGGRPPIRFQLGGQVAFWIEQSRGETRGKIEATVQVRGPSGGPIHSGEVSVSSRATGPATARLDRARREVLRRFVRRFFGDPALSRALVKAIQGAR